jgi:hypothetical protein
MPLRIRSAFLLGFVMVLLSGCDEDINEDCLCPFPPPQTSPHSVIQKLQWAYIQRDFILYAELIADDFMFFSDTHELPEFWTRVEDSTCTARLFASEHISDIRLSVLEYDPVPEAVIEPGREAWRLIQITDLNLEVDQKPLPGQPEGITYSVDGNQHFYFRKGRNPADTLATSYTSKLWFIVEWHDSGSSTDAPTSGPAAVETITWSDLKTLYCR